MISEIAPGLKRAAIMFNPDTAPVSVYMPSFETAARSLKVVPIAAPVHDDVEVETAINALGREPGAGLVLIPDVFMTVHSEAIISAAARNKVPDVAPFPEWVRGGGLLSYGNDPIGIFRRSAAYVDRILRGAKPARLFSSPSPVVDPAPAEVLAAAEVRRSLIDADEATIATSEDAMIAFARLIDPDLRAIRRAYEDQIQSELTGIPSGSPTPSFASTAPRPIRPHG